MSTKNSYVISVHVIYAASFRSVREISLAIYSALVTKNMFLSLPELTAYGIAVILKENLYLHVIIS